MADPRNPNRRVDFPEAGEGVYLLLRNSGCRALNTKYGADWMLTVEQGCNRYWSEILDKCLEVMGHKDEKPHPIKLDELDGITMEAIAKKVLDAFTLAINGRTYPEQMDWIMAEQRRLAAKLEGGEPENPPMTTGLTSPPISSTGSSDAPSEPAYTPASSGT